jgi:putative inorganic carbon (hco3(-)) transporter
VEARAARIRHAPVAAPSVARVALWSGGALFSIAIGLAAATSLTALAGLLGVLAASAVVTAAFRAPRWAVIVLLFLLYSYVGWIVSHAVGAPELSQALLLIIIAALAWRRLTREEQFSLPFELSAILALGITLAASAVFATDLGTSLRNIGDFLGYGLMIVILVALLDRPIWLRRAVWTVAIAGGVLAIVSLLQAATGLYASDFAGFASAKQEGREVFRASGPLDPNLFGQVLVATTVLALYLALSSSRSAGRWLGLAIFAACLTATALTGSRGALVAVAAAFLLVLLLGPLPRGLVAATAALVIVAGLLFLPPGLKARVGLPTSAAESVRVAPAKEGSEGAIRGRLSENLAALKMFRDNPLLGVGRGNYPLHYLDYSQEIGLDQRAEQREAHSLYLEAFAETGFFGASALLVVLWLALRGAWRARLSLVRRDALLAEGIFVALVSFLVAAMFLHSTYPRYLWILIGFGFVAGQLAQGARREAVDGRVEARGAARDRGSTKTGARKAAAPSTPRPKPARSPERRPAERRPAERSVIRASSPRAKSMVTAPPPNRRRTTLRRWLAVAGTLVAIGVALALIVSWGNDGNDGNDSTRFAEAAPSAATPERAAATPVSAVPSAPAKPEVPVRSCDPIIGHPSGSAYAVISSARDGDSAGCGEARSVLLAALNRGDASVGDWDCTNKPSDRILEACTAAGGRRIVVRN